MVISNFIITAGNIFTFDTVAAKMQFGIFGQILMKRMYKLSVISLVFYGIYIVFNEILVAICI